MRIVKIYQKESIQYESVVERSLPSLAVARKRLRSLAREATLQIPNFRLESNGPNEIRIYVGQHCHTTFRLDGVHDTLSKIETDTKKYGADLAAYTAQKAVLTLLKSWNLAAEGGSAVTPEMVLGDLDATVSHLEILRSFIFARFAQGGKMYAAELQQGCDPDTDILWPKTDTLKARLEELVPDQAEWDGHAVVMRTEEGMKELVLALRKEHFRIDTYDGFEQALYEYEKRKK